MHGLRPRAFARVISTVSIAARTSTALEFFAVTALAAVTDLPAIGWDDAPGRVVIVGDVDQINNFIQPKMRLRRPGVGRRPPRSRPHDLRRQIRTRAAAIRAPRHLAGRGRHSPWSSSDQMDMLEEAGCASPPTVPRWSTRSTLEQCRLLTRLDRQSLPPSSSARSPTGRSLTPSSLTSLSAPLRRPSSNNGDTTMPRGHPGQVKNKLTTSQKTPKKNPSLAT